MPKHMKAGSRWLLSNRIVEVDGPLTLSQVQVRDVGTGQLMPASVHELQAIRAETAKLPPMVVAQVEWDRAVVMAQAFAPFSQSASLPKTVAQKLSVQLGIGVRQVLRYRAQYQRSPLTTSLVRDPGGRPQGTRLIDSRVEQIIRHVFDKHYACRERASQAEVCERIRLICIRLKWPTPDAKTIRSRIDDAEGFALARKQRGAKAARQAFEPRPGKLVANEPLQIVQIDHTLADLMLVDDNDPLVVIGRPWLTLAIDVATRVVLGYYLSMDPPSSISVAMCLAHVMRPKAENAMGADYWPMYGKPRQILVDNGKDLRSEALKRGCQQHDIELKWRQVGKPHHGAHIERLMGTFMHMVHTLPGTTFSNAKAKGDYPSERRACFTLEDFRAWIIEKICRSYHVREHRALGEPPLLAWERAFHTENGALALPPVPVEMDRLRIDFYPFVYRRIQRTGVQHERSRYWNEALALLVHPERQLPVHYNPRDPTKVWVRTEEDGLIEAAVVAGRAFGEGRRVSLNPDDHRRLDESRVVGYERADAIKVAAETRKRTHQRETKKPASNRVAARGPAKGPATPSNGSERPTVPLNRSVVQAEVLD